MVDPGNFEESESFTDTFISPEIPSLAPFSKSEPSSEEHGNDYSTKRHDDLEDLFTSEQCIAHGTTCSIYRGRLLMPPCSPVDADHRQRSIPVRSIRIAF
jgi:hypothetical protein